MSRYTGPRVKKMRALGANLPGLSRKSIVRRPQPPGEQGIRRRRKRSDYALKLHEKQKLRFNYGLGERQLKRLVSEAMKSKTATGEKVLELLERRMDNVVFRAGFAPTIPGARQLVGHGHFKLNGRRVDVPSIRVRPGDFIELKEKSRNLPLIVETLESGASLRPDWLEVDTDKKTAKILSLPTAESVPFPIEMSQVVEFYSKSL